MIRIINLKLFSIVVVECRSGFSHVNGKSYFIHISEWHNNYVIFSSIKLRVHDGCAMIVLVK